MGDRYGSKGSRGPPNIEGMTSLKVDNLTYRTTSDDLERYFRKYGEIGDIYIPKNRNSDASRGFAFVRFYEQRDAEDAMDGMDGKVIDGREIRVAEARYGRPENQHNPRQGGGGRSGGGYGRDRSPRRSPPRRRRSASRSVSPRRRSASRSRSPGQHRRRSLSRSPRHSPSPARNSRSRSRSR